MSEQPNVQTGNPDLSGNENPDSTGDNNESSYWLEDEFERDYFPEQEHSEFKFKVVQQEPKETVENPGGSYWLEDELEKDYFPEPEHSQFSAFIRSIETEIQQLEMIHSHNAQKN